MDQKGQTQKNLVFNILSLVINVGVGLVYTPYLVRSLGIAAYGIVPLALIINQYINVITGSLTGSLTRFYSVALQKNDYPGSSEYMSSSFIAISAIVVLLIPIFVLIIFKVDSVFNIPVEYVYKAKVLFTFTLISFIFSLYSSLLNITLYAINRLDSINVIKITRVAVKVILTIALFEAIAKDVSYIGYANFFTELIVLFLSIYFFRKTAERKINISKRNFKKERLLALLFMATWVIIHQLGDTGLYRIDNILVNKFWSTRESGILGAVSEFGGYVMTIVTVIASLFGPLILIAYSKGDHDQVKELAMQNSLLVGIFTALIVGLLIGFAKPIISLWLGKEYSDYSYWFVLKQVNIPFYAAAGVFAFVNRAWNKVKFPALMTLVIGVINLLVSLLICNLSNGNEKFIIIMLIVSLIFIITQSYWLNGLFFLSLYPDLPKRNLLIAFLKILITIGVAILSTVIFSFFIKGSGIIKLSSGLIICFIISGISVFLLILSHVERKSIIDFAFSGIFQLQKKMR